ncbi:DUF1223 domain-containing protein [Loktanella sp. S4079]|uniref:DUF1223 domain-containing protein n=1 Tax=Loktanella sp. S4079 TaxID=579483 RepID=UPI0005F9FA79|nr:DUF1223 domain-containing protein [Loktanella sp. S4079]KJZ20359.1 hypothetical protein TW80_06020 [Loktanella sp. S4079]
MRTILSTLAVLSMLQTAPNLAEADPVVVELYTSQGCSSCPPADAMLHDLAQRDDVIALALHVDYWDYIGWKDVFGRAENTARQHAYARAASATTVYTPQMIVGGVDHVIGSRPMQIMDLIQSHRQRSYPVTVSLTRSDDMIQIAATSTEANSYVVELIRYLPEATVDIRRGENAGRTISYTNIVRSLDRVAEWDGNGVLKITAQAPGDDAVAVLVQQVDYGPIAGAAQLR